MPPAMLPERVPRAPQQASLPCNQPALHGSGARPDVHSLVFGALSVALLTSHTDDQRG
jgi:hypothetical protein